MKGWRIVPTIGLIERARRLSPEARLHDRAAMKRVQQPKEKTLPVDRLTRMSNEGRRRMRKRSLVTLLIRSRIHARGHFAFSGPGRRTHHLLGGMGSGELPAGTGQRVHEGDRRQGHRRDHAVAGLPDQGLHRVQRQGRRLRHGRRRLPVARRRLDRRPLRRPDRFLQASTSSTRSWRRRPSSTTPNIPATAASTGPFRSRATPSAGPIARTGSRTRRRRRPSRPSTATTSPCRRPTRSCATSPSSSIVPTRSATASRSTPTTPMTRW